MWVVQLLIVAHKQASANGVEMFIYQYLDLTALLWYVSLTAMLQGPCAWGIKVLQLHYTRCKYQPIRLSRGSKANTPPLLCAEDAQTTGRSCIPLSRGILSRRDGCFKTAVCLRLLVPAIAVGLLHPTARGWGARLGLSIPTSAVPAPATSPPSRWARGVTEVVGSHFFIPFLTPLLLWHLGHRDVGAGAWPWGCPPWWDGAWPKRERKGEKQLRMRSCKCVCESVVPSDKRNNLERYRLSELYEGACGEMIISLPFFCCFSILLFRSLFWYVPYYFSCPG